MPPKGRNIAAEQARVTRAANLGLYSSGKNPRSDTAVTGAPGPTQGSQPSGPSEAVSAGLILDAVMVKGYWSFNWSSAPKNWLDDAGSGPNGWKDTPWPQLQEALEAYNEGCPGSSPYMDEGRTSSMRGNLFNGMWNAENALYTMRLVTGIPNPMEWPYYDTYTVSSFLNATQVYVNNNYPGVDRPGYPAPYPFV